MATINGNWSINYIQGDLFSCSEDVSLAHCISADVKLGKGIALLFKKKFGGINELVNQNEQAGGCAILIRNSGFIYNLVTKGKYFQKPTYETLESSLNRMLKHARQNHVKTIAMPKIAAGLDRLDWTKVSKIIEKLFQNSGITISVYCL